MSVDALLSQGHQAAIEVAVGLRGDRAGILGHAPTLPAPWTAQDGDRWSMVYGVARIDLIDLLLPDCAELDQWLAAHQRDAAGEQAVLALVQGHRISQVRAGLFGEG